MKKIPVEITRFFLDQGCVIVSTVDKDGSPHNSCKGIIEIEKNGLVYFVDLYKTMTYDNLKRNQKISITAIDEHKFKGYCLKGEAMIIEEENFDSAVIKAWEYKVSSRITQRLIRNIHDEKNPSPHSEALLPKPQYLIVMKVNKIIDLTPHHLRQDGGIEW